MTCHRKSSPGLPELSLPGLQAVCSDVEPPNPHTQGLEETGRQESGNGTQEWTCPGLVCCNVLGDGLAGPLGKVTVLVTWPSWRGDQEQKQEPSVNRDRGRGLSFFQLLDTRPEPGA